MKIAVYPGSFNPWHDGHENVLIQGLKVFDKIIIVQMVNPEKKLTEVQKFPDHLIETYKDKIAFSFSSKLMVQMLKALPVCAIIKGIRNAQDLEYETSIQYWNEDLGIKIPTFYIITDRNMRHISSSALRQLRNFE